MVLTFYGFDALNVATPAGKRPVVFDTTHQTWRPARSFPEARAMAGSEPDSVKLVTDARVILEALGKCSIGLDEDLLNAAEQLPSPPVPPAVRTLVYNAIKDQS